MTAEILCVGTELLLGSIVNTNAAYISRELANMGIFVYYQSVVGDNPERLKKSLALSLERADIIIMTGGLGPTYDDLTKETVAEMFGLKMEMHEHSRNRIKEFFNRLNREMTLNNEKQAIMPESAVVFDNDYGTAPALAVEKNNKTVILLPGPPREMEPMFDEKIKPFLIAKSNKILVSKTVNIFGIGESAVEDKLRSLMVNATNPTVAPYAKEGEVELRVTSLGNNEEECIKKIDPVIDKIKSELGNNVYGIDVKSLQNSLVQKLKEKNITLATAESCTGGMLGSRITQISGSSEVYLGGAVTYSNDLKMKILGVKAETLRDFGAVSKETAEEMVKGIINLTGADIGISITGIAGPSGGTESKPVGLVYVGICCKKSGKEKIIVHEFRFKQGYKNGREFTRNIAASNAFFACIEAINSWL